MHGVNCNVKKIVASYTRHQKFSPFKSEKLIININGSNLANRYMLYVKQLAKLEESRRVIGG